MIAWMNNWQYRGRIPTDPWRSAMSVPQELTLQKIAGKTELVAQPVDKLQSLRQGQTVRRPLEREPVAGHEWLLIVAELAADGDPRVETGASPATAAVRRLVDRCFAASPSNMRRLATSMAMTTLLTCISRPVDDADTHASRDLVVDFVAGGPSATATQTQGPMPDSPRPS